MNHLNREYDTHRGLSHENIARVYEIVETGNSFCIVL
jgi:serine/threonine protein kinase